MLTAGFYEGFVGALHDALATDVDPAARGHLAVHGEALSIKLVEVLPGRPVWNEVGIGNQHARCVAVGFKYAHRLAGLHQQRFILFKLRQRVDDSVIAFPVACRTTDAAVNNQLIRVFRYVRVQIVHQHAQRRFGQPAFGSQLCAARGADLLLAIFGLRHRCSLLWGTCECINTYTCLYNCAQAYF
ncbi:Uncharacterised protein [Yokenella regensburgei]|nr:Uncharacterised protein [Yokenella regensburgei]